MNSEWVTHQGKKIFIVHCARLTGDALKLEFDAVEKIIAKEPEKSVLILTDVRDFITTVDSLELFKQSTAHLKKYILKETIVGIKGIKEKFLEAVEQFSGVKPIVFDDLEQAKDWLVRD